MITTVMDFAVDLTVVVQLEALLSDIALFDKTMVNHGREVLLPVESMAAKDSKIKVTDTDVDLKAVDL